MGCLIFIFVIYFPVYRFDMFTLKVSDNLSKDALKFHTHAHSSSIATVINPVINPDLDEFLCYWKVKCSFCVGMRSPLYTDLCLPVHWFQENIS